MLRHAAIGGFPHCPTQNVLSLVRLHRRFHALHRARPDFEFPHRPQYPDIRVSAARIAFCIFGSTFDRPIALRDLVSQPRLARGQAGGRVPWPGPASEIN